MWQHVNLLEQIHPWDTLACCWDVKQPTNKLPLHWGRTCRSTLLSHTVTVYWHQVNQSQCWHYNARRLAGQPLEYQFLDHWCDLTWKKIHDISGNRSQVCRSWSRRFTTGTLRWWPFIDDCIYVFEQVYYTVWQLNLCIWTSVLRCLTTVVWIYHGFLYSRRYSEPSIRLYCWELSTCIVDKNLLFRTL